ncbi:MFS transporter [Pseudodesulfovibrio sp.]|uniref:MFS transporter n=1 Tax=Pseudodesulfovibrio sp. TaxID=2035812 RepID=UPI002627EA9D|nr:MFS transporter [Pseudodesulfovibrio sp.]MDD3311226.1 MFS transporter [Pseudodesulfovibrio sp.]
MNLFRKYFVLFALSLGYAASYMLPYIKYVFYDQLLEGVGCNNEQAGFLLTVYTITALVLYIPGGWVADKFKAKYVLVASLFATGVLNFAFALNMNYSFALVVWVLLAFSTAFAFWSGIIKAIRLLGTAAEQGKLYGFFSSGVGAFSAITASVALYVYGLFTADAVGGLKGVIYVQGATCVLSSIIVFFFFEEAKDAAEESEDDKFKTSDILIVLKNPMTWAISILIFCGHGIYTSTSYFNPYMTKVIGVTMTFSGLLAIVRTHVLRLTCGPLGGIFADKLKSPALVIISCFALMTSILIVFMLLPVGTSAAVVIGLQLLLAAVTFTCYSILYSCIEEVGIPRRFTGTTVAVASMIGYLPDMIYNPLFGVWLDRFGNTGYLYIFSFLAASGVVGLFSALMIRRNSVTAVRATSQAA